MIKFMIHKFHCDFGGATADVEFNPSKVKEPGGGIKAKWAGARTAAMFPQYSVWVHGINLEISKITNRPVYFIIQDWSSDPPHSELWAYGPDGSKNRII